MNVRHDARETPVKRAVRGVRPENDTVRVLACEPQGRTRDSEIVIALPLPPVQLHPNVPCGWRAKSPHVKQARRDARLAAYNERPAVPFAACTGQATFTFRSVRRRDGDNLMAWLKHSIDGLTDAGIWVDDSVVTWLPPVVIVDHTADPGVTITVWPVESEGE